MEINPENLIKALAEKYVEDLVWKSKDELYAIFEIIMKKYKEDGVCPICDDEHFYYNNCRVVCEYSYFIVLNKPFELVIQANYCPICGKKLVNKNYGGSDADATIDEWYKVRFLNGLSSSNPQLPN